MEDNKRDQAAVRSFRVTDSTMDRFQAIREEMGLTQESALAMLVNTYELEKAKETIPDRETEIANFQLKARELVDAFLYSLQLNQDAEQRIRQEFENELNRNKKLLDEKIEQIATMKADMAALAGDAAKAKALQAELDAVAEQARKERSDAADRLAEKDRLITTLDGRIAMLEIQADGYPALLAERDALVAQLNGAKAEIRDLTKDHEMALERAAMAAEKAQETAIAAVKAESQAKIETLQERLQEAQIAAAKALQEAERSAHAAEKEAAVEIRRLEQENARLREQLAAIQVK